MNFLAHLWLTEQVGLPLAGAVLGDVLRGRIETLDLPASLAISVKFHRTVDAATDRHPAIVALRQDFQPGARRYAGIVLDLVCDFVLARNWTHYSTDPLAVFAARAGQAIAAEASRFQDAGWRPPSAESFKTLLLSYGHARGLETAFSRTGARLRDHATFDQAAQHWQRLIPPLQDALPAILDALSQRPAQD